MEANFDGMDLSDGSLAESSGIMDLAQAGAWAAEHRIPPDNLPDWLERVQRLAAAKLANPKLVNPELQPKVSHQYWRTLY